MSELAYPNSPGWKEHTTSRDAARAMVPTASTLSAAVLEQLRRHGPKTADEVAEALGQSILSIRPRFSELSLAGLIEKTNLRRPNQSGRAARVWRAVNAR
jgi:predicted ArsR family transcriptional regulator